MKIEHLTFTRFIAALAVVLFHIGANRLGHDSLPGSLFRVLNSAVSYFFVLSGFILVVSNVRQGQLPTHLGKVSFWRNRFARIYPLYLAALILTVGLGVLTGIVKLTTVSTGAAVASAVLLQAWWPDYVMQLNYPGWSLSVETLFYALFPLLFTPIVRQRTRPLLLAAGLFWAVSLAVYALLTNRNALPHFTLYFPLLHLNTFVIGIAGGVVYVRHRARLIQQHGTLTALFLGVLALNLWIVIGHLPILAYYHNGLFAPLFALFILWLSTQANPVTRWLSRPFPVWLGEISYGIYLLQVPVGMGAFYLNAHWLHWPVWGYVPAYLALLIGTAALGFRTVEQPARRFIRQWSASAMATSTTDESVSRPV